MGAAIDIVGASNLRLRDSLRIATDSAKEKGSLGGTHRGGRRGSGRCRNGSRREEVMESLGLRRNWGGNDVPSRPFGPATFSDARRS